MSDGDGGCVSSLSRAKNHFELFSLPVRFSLDRQFLESKYLELARIAHPDFAGDDADAQAAAVSLLARINEAYSILSDELSRARYMLELSGVGTDDLRVSGEIMERVFELRERLSAAQNDDDEQELRHVRQDAQQWLSQILHQAGKRLDAGERTAELGLLLSGAKYVSRITTV